jgi:hypothetical protein
MQGNAASPFISLKHEAIFWHISFDWIRVATSPQTWNCTLLIVDKFFCKHSEHKQLALAAHVDAKLFTATSATSSTPRNSLFTGVNAVAREGENMGNPVGPIHILNEDASSI